MTYKYAEIIASSKAERETDAVARLASVGTTTVEASIGRFTVPATRYTARVDCEVLMRKDGKPRTFKTRSAALKAAQLHIEVNT